MLSRITFLAVFGLILTIAGAFLAIAIFFGDGSTTAGSSSSAKSPVAMSQFEGGTPGWTVRGQLAEAAGGKLLIEFEISDLAGGRPAETAKIGVVLEMADMRMPTIRAAVTSQHPGVYHAAAELSMAGRWWIRIDLPDGPYRFLVDAGR